MMLISLWINWYSAQVSIPRYCGDPEETVQRVERVLRERRPAGDGTRLPYIVAAKLLFLLPRQRDEGIASYLERIRAFLRTQCQ